MKTYHYDAHTKEYTHSETARLDPLESRLQGRDVYLLPANAAFVAPTYREGYASVWNGAFWDDIEDNRGKQYWLAGDTHFTAARTMTELGALPVGAVLARPERTLGEMQTEALQRAQLAFADKRDAVRWIGGYGFDCAPEDITNFMAAYTPLLVAGEGTTQYKVWLTETAKGIVTLPLDTLTEVYRTVRASQLDAYAWYERVRTAIETADSTEALDALCAEEGIAEADADSADAGSDSAGTTKENAR